MLVCNLLVFHAADDALGPHSFACVVTHRSIGEGCRGRSVGTYVGPTTQSEQVLRSTGASQSITQNRCIPTSDTFITRVGLAIIRTASEYIYFYAPAHIPALYYIIIIKTRSESSRAHARSGAREQTRDRTVKRTVCVYPPRRAHQTSVAVAAVAAAAAAIRDDGQQTPVVVALAVRCCYCLDYWIMFVCLSMCACAYNMTDPP